AWDGCPNVTAGANSPYGHTLPSNQYKTAVGQLVHIDLGVVQQGYTSDLQRVWYLKKPDEEGIPEPVQKAFNAVRGAILAAAEVLKPGVEAWKVDETARKAFVTQGYAEYQHATGHHIGRSVHDGATVLGPRWPRYGKTVEGKVEAGNVFTLELGVHVPEYGFVGLEEDVLVTDSGVEWLSMPQTEIFVI
ncbi:MAG: M24 family metallopeptidase, partial [Anaerolineae bacterium]|nr:M24 family metallopeptidase [Anaerolineae bacterium]